MDMNDGIAPVSETKPAEAPQIPPSHVEVPADSPRKEEAGRNVPVNDKSDSEAETVVLSGKEQGQDLKRKTIKLEEAESDAVANKQDQVESRKPSLKRKRKDERQGDALDCRESSNLSSAISSPAPQMHSSKASETRSDRSRSSPPLDASQDGMKRHKTSLEGIIVEVPNGREKRETRSATHFDEASQRSESPPRAKHRAQSTSTFPPPIVTRRRKPAPLQVDQRRKASEDQADSDDSSSVHSHHQKITSDGHAMSPVKVSQKKNRDRSGRTLLARACASGIFPDAQAWTRDRPEDLNVPDNAGNTPLQIASLEGNDEIVQLLLDAGCDINCKNIDSDTPLIDAVENGHLEVVKLLLKAGLDPRIGNAVGKEPLLLVKPEHEESEEIRAVLLAAKKERESTRKLSDDHQRQGSVASRDAETVTASGASPTESTRSPPPIDPGRRKTARSQQTSTSLLWVNATPQKLREAAAKGDVAVIDHILRMNPRVDVEPVLLAARGGHEMALGLILALAQPKPDPNPEPIQSREHKPGWNTPMLAAIGRGRPAVLELLLDQPGFDPTRRPYRDLKYHEIAKERKSPVWQAEYEILKKAYDEHRKTGGRRSNSSTPRRVRKQAASGKSTPDRELSSPYLKKPRRPHPVKHESDPDLRRKPSYKGTASRQRGEGQDISVPSDHDPEANVKSRREKKRANSDAASTRPDGLKPKRKLMSGHELKLDQDQKRRASHEENRRKSGESSSHDPPRKTSNPKSKKATSEEPARKESKEPGKKRLRVSVSPQASRNDLNEVVKKKKRQRVNSQGNAIDQDRERTTQPGSAAVANMIASPQSASSGPGTAPVAFMGSSTGSPMTKSPIDGQIRSAMISPVNSIDQALQQSTEQEAKQAEETTREELRLEAIRAEEMRLAVLEAERLAQIEVERERQVREEAERQAIEEARLEAQRQSEEAERQLQLERDAEEARISKKKRDEELQKRRQEEERQRKEDQERRRREREEREALRLLRQQEEEQRARMEALPNGLKRAAELDLESSRNPKEIMKWLPLRTVTTHDLDPSSDQAANEQWIANIQAAPILAIQDLELSQYTAWTRLPATPSHHGSLWRQLRNPMSQSIPCSLLTPSDVVDLDNATKPKFLALKVFWVKLSDFMDIVPRHPHLMGIELRTREMVLHEFPFGRPTVVTNGSGGVYMEETGMAAGVGVKEEGVVTPVVVNGNGAVGLGLGLVNGYR